MNTVKIFAILILLPLCGMSQNIGSVQGKVLDAEMFNEPLLMASVSLEATEFLTTTNFNGNFELRDVTPGTYTLLISFLGYETLEKEIEVIGDATVYLQEVLAAKSNIPVDVLLADTAEKEKAP